MATFDLILVAIVLVSAVIGLRRGLVKETLSLASWIGSFFAGLYFSPLLTALVADSVGDGAIVKTVTFFIAQGVALLLAINVLWAAERLVKSTELTGTDRFLGFVFGGARGVVVSLVALMGLQYVAAGAFWWEDSELKDGFLQFEYLVFDAYDAVNETVQEIQAPENLMDVEDIPDMPDADSVPEFD